MVCTLSFLIAGSAQVRLKVEMSNSQMTANIAVGGRVLGDFVVARACVLCLKFSFFLFFRRRKFLINNVLYGNSVRFSG